MIIKDLNNDKGFTLVELLLSLAIMSIILLPLTMTVTTGYKTFFREDENIDVMQNGRFAMDKMVRAIREADPSNIIVTDTNRLRILSDEIETEYFRDGNWIYEKKGASPKKEIARHINALLITKNNNGLGQLKSIDIEIVLSSERLKNYTLKTTVYLRNR